MLVELHSAARRELKSATRWYRDQSVRAASGLVEDVRNAFKRICDQPELFAKTRRSFRICRLQRYPYQIIFRDEGERIYVIAIAHDRRRPFYWQRRK